jgi:hypothetical protein
MRLVALAFTLAFTLAILMTAAPCDAAGFRIEAESMIAAHDEGGVAVVMVGCGYASGGLAIQGLDSPGDWIELRLELSQTTVFVDSLRSAGLKGELRDFSVLFLTGGDPLGAPGDTVTSEPGKGFD